jgi:uncharacterized membrane protein
MFSLGFVTYDDPRDPLVSVFLATTPNPTSGYMLLIPRAQVQVLPLPVEDAIKLVVSGGAVMTRTHAHLIAGTLLGGSAASAWGMPFPPEEKGPQP